MEIPYCSSQVELYLESKQLSASFGVLLATPLSRGPLSVFATFAGPTAEQAFEAWEEITHNRHERKWKGYLRGLRSA